MKSHSACLLIAAFGLTFLTIGCEETDWASFAVDMLFDFEYTLSLAAPDSVHAPTLPANVRVVATLRWAGLPMQGAFVRTDGHCFLTGESGRANCDVSFHEYGRTQVIVEALDSTQMVIATADKWIVITS